MKSYLHTYFAEISLVIYKINHVVDTAFLISVLTNNDLQRLTSDEFILSYDNESCQRMMKKKSNRKEEIR